jgi:hypothetical protein
MAKRPLRLVTDEMVADDAIRLTEENVAIAHRLVNNPASGITRVTVCSSVGTFVVEPRRAPAPTPIPEDAAHEESWSRLASLRRWLQRSAASW